MSDWQQDGFIFKLMKARRTRTVSGEVFLPLSITTQSVSRHVICDEDRVKMTLSDLQSYAHICADLNNMLSWSRISETDY